VRQRRTKKMEGRKGREEDGDERERERGEGGEGGREGERGSCVEGLQSPSLRHLSLEERIGEGPGDGETMRRMCN